MKKELPYFAIGNEELVDKKPVGRTATCPKCKKKHLVEYGTTEGKINNTLGFVTCKKTTYLVSVAGKEL